MITIIIKIWYSLMIRRILKKKKTNSKLDQFISKYNIPREYLSINRKSISRGVSLGLFIGFIPMPMQMLAVILFTPFFKFNVPVAISMVWLSNPITMPFMYYMEYQTGNYLLGQKDIENIQLTLSWFSNNWDNIVFPLYIGTIPYSLLIPPLMYNIINILWIFSVKKEKARKVKKL